MEGRKTAFGSTLLNIRMPAPAVRLIVLESDGLEKAFYNRSRYRSSATRTNWLRLFTPAFENNC